MHDTPYSVQEVDGFRYIEEGPRESNHPPVVLLHGLLGDLSNWTDTIEELAAHDYHVLAPVLPIFHLPLRRTSVPGLVRYVRDFAETVAPHPSILVGNSLGGHIALIYALRHPDDVAVLVLSGASGIYEVTMGNSMFRRQDREFIRERTELTFYDPVHATDELVDEMFEIVNDRPRAVRLIKIARSAEEETVTERLFELEMPTLLIWGRNDVITPPDVAEEFRDRLPDAQLHFINECGHAPMIEHPDQFNALTVDFLEEQFGPAELTTSSHT
jgi:pimeloyl-ACP methyl ester carboxylesterase